MPEKLAVLGAGSWGIAIANLLFKNGHAVKLWEFDSGDCRLLQTERVHRKKLPDIRIPEEILITNSLNEALEATEYLVLAVPTQKVRSVCESLRPMVPSGMKYVNLAKGVEIGTLRRVSEIILTTIDSAESGCVATLSGPSHAEEVSRNLPTSVVAASINAEFARVVQRLFNNSTFRVYHSEDIIGVELGGSLKNVIAIASGITQGLGFGDNTTGALLTRGLAEITRMGVRLGADPLTFAGLSGVGDLITTCISRHSRNRYVGDKIGRGEKLRDILAGMVMVAEGVDTTRSAKALADKYGVEMPITEQVFRILFEERSPKEALADLMGRSLKQEVWN
ncbi:Glycerol-3-phosphate dehydrogenase (NAD(P)+) [Candidatus Zixiibacteriota bacterium]|nr:Glycerol-3-phosphate dehydrogenase (NAD(P)+) [candidate division Zixibacteria bacterium]